MKKIGGFVFQVANGGLMVTVEGKEYRLDPTESMALLDYLEGHRVDFQKVLRLGMAETGVQSREWDGQKLDEAFENLPE